MLGLDKEIELGLKLGGPKGLSELNISVNKTCLVSKSN